MCNSNSIKTGARRARRPDTSGSLQVVCFREDYSSKKTKHVGKVKCTGVDNVLCVNDPSAGSPTETLLRLLLPLNDQV